NILGQTYNVEFMDGACAQFYDGCDESFDFFFQSEGVANEASRALAEQVFPGVSPLSIRGCGPNSANDSCQVFTPWGLASFNNELVIVSTAVVYAPDDARFVGNGSISPDNDISSSPFSTYAIWTFSTPQPARCGDSVDNDGDGLIDFPNDPGCSAVTDDNEADATLTFNAEGQVSGATGVAVAGELLNVQFVDGSCAEIFGGCDETADFFFGSSASTDADAASRALAQHVLPGLAPKAIAGCGPLAVSTCRIFTPWDPTVFASIALLVSPDDTRFVGNGRLSVDFDYRAENFSTFAVWSTQNEAPTAYAGPDQSIRAGDTVSLDGSGSFDDNTPTASLLYSWSFASLPAGSSAVIAGANTATPTFDVDIADTYIVQLVVTDANGLGSAPDFVVISAGNLAPTASAGDDQLVEVGTVASLDGSGSTDPELDPLSYAWSISDSPDGSAALLNNADTATPMLVTDVLGAYLIQLIVSDAIGPGEPDTTQITAVSATDLAQALILAGSDIVTALDADQVTSSGNQKALANFFSQAIIALQTGDLDEAREKLEMALARTDGCPIRGTPDATGSGRDWITDCAVQIEVYAQVDQALQSL
ncbi:MAG: PKD domain-containing protein, partial [Gammaproteobacteria bacterium]